MFLLLGGKRIILKFDLKTALRINDIFTNLMVKGFDTK